MNCCHFLDGHRTSLPVLSVVARAMVALASIAAPSFGGMVNFGSGANEFTMEIVTIGDPGNDADANQHARPLNAGRVTYTFDIGKFEVSREMITKYNGAMENASLQITLADMTAYGGNGLDKPATGVSWNEAARFVNWLNESTGNAAAYKFTTSGVNDNISVWQSGDAGYDVSNPYRNRLAKFVLPSYDEWYKAAYYNPDGGNYYIYPHGSNTQPEAVSSGLSGVVYYQQASQGPADVTQAGGLSPYGAMGLGGNVWELQEGSAYLDNSNPSSDRGFRGGTWNSDSYDLSVWRFTPYNLGPSNDTINIGFRVAMVTPLAAAVPEPSTMVIGTILGLGGLLGKRRMKR